MKLSKRVFWGLRGSWRFFSGAESLTRVCGSRSSLSILWAYLHPSVRNIKLWPDGKKFPTLPPSPSVNYISSSSPRFFCLNISQQKKLFSVLNICTEQLGCLGLFQLNLWMLKGEKLCRDFKILRYGNIYSSDSLEAGLLGSEFNLTVIGGNCWTKLSDWLI